MSFPKRFDARTKVHEVVDSMRYKNGWTFSVMVNLLKRRIELSVEFVAADVKARTIQPICVTRVECFTGDEDYDEIKRKIADAILDHEFHEYCEWLKFDGDCYREPHP